MRMAGSTSCATTRSGSPGPIMSIIGPVTRASERSALCSTTVDSQSCGASASTTAASPGRVPTPTIAKSWARPMFISRSR